MTAETRTFGLLGALVILVASAGFAASGCTVIRYVDKDDDGGGGGNDEPDPKVVDMLVQADLRRSASAFSSDYQQLLGTLTSELQKKNVKVRRAALAPMYRRSGGDSQTVPLVFGKGDQDGDFSSFGEAYGFYTRDDGASHLTDRAAADGENLAALGLNLDSRSVYHPKSADPSGSAYFKPPEDGFIVVSFTASSRGCGASSRECQLNGKHPAVYFTQKQDGDSKWLNLPGKGDMPPSRIYHLAVATPEGVDQESMRDRCYSYPNFPKTKADFMQASENSYFEPLTDRIADEGGRSRYVDLCRAISSEGPTVMKNAAGEIAGMF